MTPRRGFSLVEIVLAMGVISFAVVAILGLISLGINSAKGSLDESLVAAMSRQVVANLRQQQFSGNPLFATIPTAGPATTIQTAYFDTNGTLLTGSTQQQALQQGGVYRCVVTGSAVIEGPAPKLSATSPCMVDLDLTFTWPLGATAANSFSLRTGLARYY
jgi:uncharacterized protein (TIGR02598 family)